MERSSILVLLETCRVSCQNKFVKLVHLVGFIIIKFVTMQGHVNLKWAFICYIGLWSLEFLLQGKHRNLHSRLSSRCFGTCSLYSGP